MGFRLLGGFDVVAAGAPLDIGGPRQRAILAALVLRANTVVPTDALVSAVWGPDAGPSARGLVRTYVSRLRQVLAGTDWALRGQRPGYVLEAAPADIDARVFEAQVRRAQGAVDSGCLRDGLRQLDEALALWHGDPLADLQEFEFARAAGDRLSEAHLGALEARLDTRLALGHHAQVVGELEGLVVEQPYREGLWRQLITALYRAGRQADALAAYQRLRSMLVGHLGIDPSEELQALERDVLRQSEALRWRPPPGPAATVVAPEAAAGRVREPAAQVGRPPVRALAFQARSRFAALFAGGRDLILVGGGGVGKTQLAADAFRSARDARLGLVVWVDATSRESILAAYAEAYATRAPSAAAARPVAQAAEAFLAALATSRQRWLVVLDDVERPEVVRELWPEGPAGRVIATTRRRDLDMPDAETLLVEPFTPAEAQGYLAARLAGSPALPAHPGVLDEADGLADDLGGLPVALAQAAAVIMNDGLTCAAYRARFADRTRRLSQLLPPEAAADGYPGSLATTWSLAAEEADLLSPGAGARRALHLAAVADRNGAPAELWSHPSARAYVEGDGPGGGPGAPRAPGPDAALRSLHRLSLIDHDPGAGLVRMHALVQRAVVDSLPGPERRRAYRATADALVELWPSRRAGPSRAATLRQNMAVVAAGAGDALFGPSAHPLLACVGQGLEEAKLMEDATGHWRAVWEAAGRLLGGGHPDAVAARLHWVDCQGEAGDAAGAAAAASRLVDDRRRVAGEDHPDTLAARHSFAWWTGHAGDPEAAAGQLAGILDDTQDVLGADHPHTLATRNHLAFWQGEAGDPAAAASTSRRLVEDRRRLLGDDDPDTLATRHSLAWWTGIAGDPRAAADEVASVVDRIRALLGPDHPHTLAARNHLVYWQGACGDPTTAADGARALVEDRRRLLGEDHPDTLAARNHLASWQGEASGPTDAVALLVALVRDRQRVLGAHHPDTRTTHQHLGWWERVAADSADAAAWAALRADRHFGLGCDTNAQSARLGQARHRPGRRWPAPAATAVPPGTGVQLTGHGVDTGAIPP